MYSSFNFHSYKCTENYTEGLNKCIWATFENHWDMLLRECAKSREKETQVNHWIFSLNAYCPKTKHQLRHDITAHLNFSNTRN